MRAPKQFESTRERLPSLVSVIRQARNLLILTHENPDPDCIASSFSLQHLARNSAHVNADVAYNGVIGRAENRAMIRLLGFDMIHTDRIDWEEYDMIAAVDYQPRQNWRRLPGNRTPTIIIDHHPRRHVPESALFVDIRRGFGANSTIMSQYLRAARLSIPKHLATGLIYGILSDTQQFARGATPDDLDAYLHLFARCDHASLSQITHPTVDISYLRDYWRGFRNARQTADVITCSIGPMCVPDLISDVADRMVAIGGVRWALVMGIHDDVMHLSLRSRKTRRDAGQLIRRLVGRKGSAGGHGFMAGGQIRIRPRDNPDALGDRLSNQFIRLIHGTRALTLPSVPLIDTPHCDLDQTAL